MLKKKAAKDEKDTKKKTAVKAPTKQKAKKALPKKEEPKKKALAAKTDTAKISAKKTAAPKEAQKPKAQQVKEEPKSAPVRIAPAAAKPVPPIATKTVTEKPAAKLKPPIEEKAPEKKISEAPPKQQEPLPKVEIPVLEMPQKEEIRPRILEIELPISVKDLAVRIGCRPNELILNLMSKSVFANINQTLGEEIVVNILKDYNIEYKKPEKPEDRMIAEHRELEEKQDVRHLVTRPPVVTFMGHVDHGKTSLLDFIRKTKVADKEKGGITQHIGAYEVKFKKGSVTFLDTPGHEAFTAMRARGANATDVVVLVVAADDGVMPQTKEALDHARAAGVTIVVAINKCDLPSANIDKVKSQLSQLGLMPEDWGGKTIVVPVSAKTGEGVDHLLEMLLLESELLELKANPYLKARGVVIEGKLSSGQGTVATVLVKNGTLRLGDMVLTGMYYGRVKAMMNDKQERISEALPSKPVSILGLSGVPMAGDEFFVVKDEKKARTLSTLKQDEARRKRLRTGQRITLEDFYQQMKDNAVKELAIVLKGDVQGSLEALQKSFNELNAKNVKINIIHSDVGNVNESDVMLALVSNAVIIGFNVKVEEGAQTVASKEDVEIKIYGIIYEAIQDIAAAMEGLLEPVSKEVFVGRASVKQVFRVSKVGVIAGCSVVRGKIIRSGITKLIRDKQVIYQGKISSLKRFKDDVREVNENFECGIGLDRHDDIKVGDLIEVYQIEKVARRLESKKS